MNRNTKLKKTQSSMWSTPRNDYFRQGGSTGARISTKRPSFTQPKGGLYGSGYEAARQMAAYYGRDPEEFVREQLGPKHHHRNWDFYKKNILGRDHYGHTYAPFPRFPKKKWPGYSRLELQEGTKYSRSEPYGWNRSGRYVNTRSRFGSSWTNKRYRRSSFNWSNRKVYSNTVQCRVSHKCHCVPASKRPTSKKWTKRRKSFSHRW